MANFDLPEELLKECYGVRYQDVGGYPYFDVSELYAIYFDAYFEGRGMTLQMCHL